MTDKELRRLSRRDLLEMMLAQSKQIDRLKAEISRLKGELDSKKITIEKAGSIAEASLALSGVFEAVQKAVDYYLANTVGDSGDSGQQ